MKAISPVLPSHPDFPQVIFAKDQPEYLQLPAIMAMDRNNMVTTRWRLTAWERITVLFFGNVYLQILAFNRPLQPLKLGVVEPLPQDCVGIPYREMEANFD